MPIFVLVSCALTAICWRIGKRSPAGAVGLAVIFGLFAQVAAPPYRPFEYHPFDDSPGYDTVFFSPATSRSSRDFAEALWLEDQLDSLPTDVNLFFAPSASATNVTGIYAPIVTHKLLKRTPGGDLDDRATDRLASGEIGLKLAKSNSFSVVITELRMPGMNGVDVTRAIRKISPMTEVIVITAFSFIGSAVEAMEAGAYGYVTKPFNSSEIKIAVSRALERLQLLGSGQKKEHYAELSAKDGLTSIFNRRFLDIFIPRKIEKARNSSEEFSVVMIDIDHFKEYNDTHGHVAGDEALKKTAELLQASLRGNDVVFRYGGEEFALCLDKANKRCADMVAERVRSSVELYLPVTISMGISSYPEDGKDMDALIKKADGALYQAKESGRNRICLA